MKDYQIIWRWRSFLWPFYACTCDEHGRHLVYDGWVPFIWNRFTPDWSLSVIYRWIIRVGPLEIRRWIQKQDKATALAAHNKAING